MAHIQHSLKRKRGSPPSDSFRGNGALGVRPLFDLNVVLNATVDGILIADAQTTKYVLANSAMCRMSGYDAEEIVELDPKALHPPEALADVERHFKEFMAETVPRPREIPVKRKDGSVFYASITTSPMTVDGQLYAVGVFRDITQQRQDQSKLRASEETFRIVCETAQDAIVIINPKGRVTYWNPAAERMLGYTKDEACGKDSIVEWLSPERYRSDIIKELSELRAGINRYPLFVNKIKEVKHRDGSEIPIELSVTPSAFSSEPFVVVTMRDIRERKLAEKTLCENDVQLSNALQIARAGNWTYDVATDQFTFNDNFYRIFRTTAAEVGGYTMTSAEYTRRFVYPEDAAVVANETELALRSPNPNYSQEIEHRIIFKGGEIGYMAVRFFIVKDQAGKTVKTYGVNQDITQRKRDEGTLRRLNRTLRALSGASTLMVRATSEQQLLDDMCQVIVEVGGYALAWIAQPDDTKFVTPIAHAGAGAGYLENIQIRWDDCVLGRGPTGAAIRTGKVQVNRDFAANPLMRPWLKDAQAYGFCSSISLPLKGPSSTFGALVIYSAASDVFDAEEVELLTELSRDLTYGILALRDHIGREEALKGLQSSLEATVEALANTAERRDPYTAGHQRRVAEIAEAIARRMRLPESQVQGIRLAGIIHDVGKVQVPTEILSKPGRISPLEFELIKEHSQAGYDIVKRIEFPWPIADIILQHHERIDGSGYPNGLKGDAIMLEAKIIAVADTVEAMMSHRPYRPALGLDAALAEIERGKGLIYDPSVAEACLALFREDGFTMTRDSSPA